MSGISLWKSLTRNAAEEWRHRFLNMHVYFKIRPGYEFLAEEMVDYAMKNMPNFEGRQQFMLQIP